MTTSNKSDARVLVFGEVLWDQLPSGNVLGGAPANFATRVQYLGVPVTMATRVGTDALGDEALAQLTQLGIDVTAIQRDKTLPTGTVEVTVDDAGSATYTILPNVAYDNIEASPELLATAKQSELIYFGTLAQRTAQARKSLGELLAAAPQAIKLLDVNLRRDCYTQATVQQSMERADILKLNEDEVHVLSALLKLGVKSIKDFCDAVMSRYDLNLCLVTRGAQGVVAHGRDGEYHAVAGYDVKVVDTIGAGDAFTAGFVWSYIRGGSLRDNCELGTRLGALVATQRGGMAPITIEQLMAASLKERRSHI